MGLQLLEEMYVRDKETYDLVNDMKVSSAAAVEILNDLLMYEKIESNLLTIELDESDIFESIQDIINLFRIQVS